MSETAVARMSGEARAASTPMRPAGTSVGAAPGTGRFARPLILLYLLLLAVPLFMHVGDLRLSPYRILLLASVLPTGALWLMGRAGRIILPDLLLVGFVLWATLTLFIHHGAAAWQGAGMFAVETLGPWFLARVLIRTPEAFRVFVGVFLAVCTGLLVVAVIESLTGRMIVSEILAPLGEVFPNANREPRWGLARAQATFEHPILYGVFVSAGLALFYYTMGRGPGSLPSLLGASVSGLATFFSLSMGAFISVILQVLLIGWDMLTRLAGVTWRWRMLAILCAAAYATVDMLSNRTPFHVFVDYLTFNQGNAYNRVLIWQYGSAEVWRHPVFGIGMNEWQRAPWMSTSMDNMWLLMAVRHGLPGFLMLAGTFLVTMWRVGASPIGDPRLADARKGFLIGLGGVMLAVCTVHLWNASYTFMIFLLGSGLWFIDQAGPGGGAAEAAPAAGSPHAGGAAPRSRAVLGAETPPRTTAAPARPGLERPSRAHVIGALEPPGSRARQGLADGPRRS